MAFESNANEWENAITWFRKWVMYATQGQQALTKDSWQRFAKRNDISIDISNMVWEYETSRKANELMEDDTLQEAWDKWCNHVRKTLGGNIIYDETTVKTGDIHDWIAWASSGFLYKFDPQDAVFVYQVNKGDIDWEVSKYDKKKFGKYSESKSSEDKNCQHPDCVGARAEDILFNNFVVPRGGGMKCNHCGKYWSEEPENTFTSAQALDQPIVQDLLHHARTHGITESKAREFSLHISKHHGDDHEVTQTCEECGITFGGDPFQVNEKSMEHVIETGHTTFMVNTIGDKKYHESLEFPIESVGSLVFSKTKEWWDMQEYDDKLSFLSERFRQAGELAKARWVHLPSHVKDSIMNWVNRKVEGESIATEWDDTPVQCPNCHGEGRWWHSEDDWDETCPVCEGDGWIDRSSFQKGGTNVNYAGGGGDYRTHDWSGKPEILFTESKAIENWEDTAPLRDQYGNALPMPSGRTKCHNCGKEFDDWNQKAIHIEIVHNLTGRKRSHYPSGLPYEYENHPDWTGFVDESLATEELDQCPTCDGLGTIWTDTTYDEGYSDLCPTCSGRGAIVKDVYEQMWESGTSDGAKKGWFDRKLANAPTIHDDDEISDTSKFQNVIESLTSESSGKVFADFMKRGDSLTDEEVNSMSVDQYRKWLKKVNKGIKNTSIGDSWY